MNLLILSKRRPQQRDLLTRPYGRFFHIPKYLAAQGHDVSLLLFSYKNEASQHCDLDGIQCYSESALPWGPGAYFRRAEQIIATKKPDWIIGCSDSWYGLAASYLGRRHGIRVLLDAYDNYESYIPWLGPLHRAWRKALGNADAVTAAGPNLAARMAGPRAKVVPMAADPIFQPMNRDECRRRLGLPLDKRLLGYSGAIHPSRNMDMLFDTFRELRNSMPDLELVLSGRVSADLKIPVGARLLGYIPDAHMPLLLNSLDALAVMNRPSAFGHYSYPAKLYEAMRCEIPVVATETDSVRWILQYHSECLSRDPADFSRHAARALQRGRIRYRLPHENNWEASGELLHQILTAGAPASR